MLQSDLKFDDPDDGNLEHSLSIVYEKVDGSKCLHASFRRIGTVIL